MPITTFSPRGSLRRVGRRANTLAFRDPWRRAVTGRRQLIAFFFNVSYLLKQYCFPGLIFLASADLMALSAYRDLSPDPACSDGACHKTVKTYTAPFFVWVFSFCSLWRDGFRQKVARLCKSVEVTGCLRLRSGDI